MPRGGSRPGAGRKPDPDRAAKRAAMAQRARDRQQAAVKTTGAPAEWPFGTAAAQGPAKAAETLPDDEQPVISGDSPLEFLVAVMKSDKVKLPVRMQAAAIAAPFLHAKPAPTGKKSQQKDDAAKAGGKSKFAPAAAPKLVAAGGRKV